MHLLIAKTLKPHQHQMIYSFSVIGYPENLLNYNIQLLFLEYGLYNPYLDIVHQ